MCVAYTGQVMNENTSLPIDIKTEMILGIATGNQTQIQERVNILNNLFKVYKIVDAMRKAELQNERIKVRFPYDRDMVKRIRGICDSRFHKDDGRHPYWTIPNSPVNKKKLVGLGFQITESASSKEDSIRSQIAKVRENIVFDGGFTKLHPYQKDGVAFSILNEGNVLIADDMGLGKTATALASVRALGSVSPIVVVCPSSPKYFWQKEIKSWLGEDSHVMNGTNRKKLPDCPFYIVNYRILIDRLPDILDKNPQAIILDEVHKIKNKKAKRTKKTLKLAKSVKHVIALTGTPMQNRPDEMFNVLNLLRPEVFDSEWHFWKRYCGLTRAPWGLDHSGATNMEELNMKLMDVMIRHKKKDVLPELPDKTTSVIPMDLSDRGEYEKASSDLLSWVRENKGTKKAISAMKAEALTKVSYLTDLVANLKLKSCIAWLEDFVETGNKIVVFTKHKKILNDLYSCFEDIAVTVSGKDDSKARNEAVERFQNDDNIKLFIGNMDAASESLTLTAASSVAFVELSFVPGQLEQAEDRVNRIGQENKCNIYYLIARNTIEEDVLAVLDEKRAVLTKAVDGKDVKLENMFVNMLKGITERK